MAGSSGLRLHEYYEKAAEEKLARMVYDFYASGAHDGWTLAANRRAFAEYQLVPRHCRGVAEPDIRTNVLGATLQMPVMVAPASLHAMAHPEGELATARGAAAVGTAFSLSTAATRSIEEVAECCQGLCFFQLYVYKDRQAAADLVHRAEKAGYKAIILTVDLPRIGRREADVRNKFQLPHGLTLKNVTRRPLKEMEKKTANEFFDYTALIDDSLTWKDVQWLRSITALPILLKGVLTGQDACIALENGASGVIVSNHGGRQLDHVSPSVSALEEVVHAIAGRCPVFMDGGIRRGEDVLIALALGASGVFVGRPVLYGLAVDGEAGVANVLRTLAEELKSAMSWVGCSSLEELRGMKLVKRRNPLLSKL